MEFDQIKNFSHETVRLINLADDKAPRMLIKNPFLSFVGENSLQFICFILKPNFSNEIFRLI